MKILAPVGAPRSALLGLRAAAGLGLGRGAGAAAFAFAGVVRTVGRSATGRGRGADDVARRGGSLRPADSRRGVSLRGGSPRGGSERFGGSRRGGSARPGLRGGSEARGGTCGRRGWPV
ncbi:hypothetical protein [Lentzea sp. NPDC055074]